MFRRSFDMISGADHMAHIAICTWDWYLLSPKLPIVNWKKNYIKDIQILGMNMPFVSSSEAKNAYFMSGEAKNEIFIFSLHEMK